MPPGLSNYLLPDEEDQVPASLQDYMSVNGMDNAEAMAVPYSPQTNALAQMYEEQARKIQAEEQGGLNQLSQYIDDYATQDQPTDYRALAAWADSLNPGGKALQVAEATAPPSRTARQEKLFALQNMLQQRQGGMAQRQLTGLQAMLGQRSAADRLAARQALQERQFKQQQDLAEKKAKLEEKRTQTYEESIAAKERIAEKQLQASLNRVEEQQRRADDRQQAGLDEKRDLKTDDMVVKFEQKAIDAVPLVENLNVIEGIIGGKLEQFDPKTGTINGKKVDLPGKSVPGVGRVFAPGSVGETLQTAFSNIFNTTLKDRSGAAVTDQELMRLKGEFAQGKFNTEEKMVEALQRYKNILRKRMRQHEAAYNPEVRTRYKSQGGALVEDLLPEVGAGAPPPDANLMEWPKGSGNMFRLNGDTWDPVQPGEKK